MAPARESSDGYGVRGSTVLFREGGKPCLADVNDFFFRKFGVFFRNEYDYTNPLKRHGHSRISPVLHVYCHG